MEIYGPSKNKVSAIRESNPIYYQLLLSRSEYSQTVVEQVLSETDEVNAQLHTLLSSAYDLLVDEDALRGFSSDAHSKLSIMLAEISYLYPHFSENSHANCFPVRKWQKEIASLKVQIAKIEKFISKMDLAK